MEIPRDVDQTLTLEDLVVSSRLTWHWGRGGGVVWCPGSHSSPWQLGGLEQVAGPP